MKPLITLIREALAERLRQSEEVTVFVGGEKKIRISLHSSAAAFT